MADVRLEHVRKAALDACGDYRLDGEEFDRWIRGHNEGQRIAGIRGLLDFRPLPREVRLYIEGYLEAAAEDAVSDDVALGGDS